MKNTQYLLPIITGITGLGAGLLLGLPTGAEAETMSTHPGVSEHNHTHNVEVTSTMSGVSELLDELIGQRGDLIDLVDWLASLQQQQQTKLASTNTTQAQAERIITNNNNTREVVKQETINTQETITNNYIDREIEIEVPVYVETIVEKPVEVEVIVEVDREHFWRNDPVRGHWIINNHDGTGYLLYSQYYSSHNGLGWWLRPVTVETWWANNTDQLRASNVGEPIRLIHTAATTTACVQSSWRVSNVNTRTSCNWGALPLDTGINQTAHQWSIPWLPLSDLGFAGSSIMG